MQKIRIGMAQINTTVGDLAGNTEKIISCIVKGREWGVDVLTFPELAITGYPPEDLLLKPHFIKDNQKYLKKIIPRTKDILTIIGFVDGGKKIYNSAAVISDGKLRGIYHKILLPNYGVFDEKRYFTAGDSCPVFQWANIIFGVTICEDIWFKDGPVKIQSQKGKAKLILNISSSPYHVGKETIRKEMLKERAKENGVIIAYNNLVGGQDELVFDGNSLIMDAQGRIVREGKKFEEELIIADVEIPAARIRKQKYTGKEKPILPVESKDRKKVSNKWEEVYTALVLGTRDYVKKNGFEKVVIGLSGGIDSALTAVIAVDALGKENVIGVSMPSPFTSERSINDAKDLSVNLDIRLLFLPIEPAMQAYQKIFQEVFLGINPDITEENLQARIRGNLLMALSNKFGWLVLTTGNKSETSVGYCTLYGDMAGGFAVIKDIPKTMVYKLVQFRNKRDSKEIIPESSIDREPTAELKPDQKDSDSLPPYETLDPILEKYIEQNWGMKKIIGAGNEIFLVKKIINMVNKNEYKRRQAPPGIKITPLAFGKDRRFPITQRYREGEVDGLKGEK